MTQHELDCAVADATGEELSTIESMGFGVEPRHRFDDDEPVLVVNCPFCGAAAILANTPAELPEYAECSRCDTVFDYSDDEIESVSLDELIVAPRRSFVPAA